MITIVDNFIKDISKINLLYQFFNSIGTNWKYPFLKLADLDKPSNLFHLDITKEFTKKVYNHEATKVFNLMGVLGYESWVNCMDTGNDGLSYHMDCNEDVKEGTWEHGRVTAILYIGEAGDMVGGDLILNAKDGAAKEFYQTNTDDPRFDLIGLPKGEIKKPYWVTIPYKFNRLILFDPSKYPHAVTPMVKNCSAFHDKKNRITIQMTAWDKELNIKKEY